MAVREPLLSTAEFEELARVADRIAEGLRLEFVAGVLSAKPLPNGNHGCIITWLIRQCLAGRPELWLSPSQGLVVGADRRGRARPDGVLADSEAFVGQGEWADAAAALMVVEIATHDRDTDRWYRSGKSRCYAATGIPVYLLIDRDAREVIVYSDPSNDRYQQIIMRPFGSALRLPDPVSIILDTEPLVRWAA
ncbi:Uma2 family endonuclease [Nocardia tenerifensis]|uniref:Uma2 family endonuclease n=1 Tax=Nocardia tenerifensis TaxID=228006 RepID=A0A318KQI1_9NOCA|nr:Uma2 family endonuclease [Nocardia tenerifensis]PXX65187.1 Uma2 family endonuclease [Nocardia tenerifensis]